jgi:hypothetical protein
MGFGFKAGLHWASIPEYSGPLGGLDSGSVRNLCGGPFVVFPLAGILELQPEAMFVEKGARLEATSPDLSLEATLELQYLEFPILGRIAIQRSGTTRWYTLAGPSFGYQVRARERIESLGQESEQELPGAERFEVSLVLGGGVRAGWFVAEARFTQGLTRIEAGGSSDFKNRGFAVLLGVHF